MFPNTSETSNELAQTVIDIAHELACAPHATPSCPDEDELATARWEPNFVGGWEKALTFHSEDGTEAYVAVVGGGFDESDGTTFVNVHVEGTDAGTTWLLTPGASKIEEEYTWSDSETLPVWIGTIVLDALELVASSRKRSKLA